MGLFNKNVGTIKIPENAISMRSTKPKMIIGDTNNFFVKLEDGSFLATDYSAFDSKPYPLWIEIMDRKKGTDEVKQLVDEILNSAYSIVLTNSIKDELGYIEIKLEKITSWQTSVNNVGEINLKFDADGVTHKIWYIDDTRDAEFTIALNKRIKELRSNH